MQSKYQIEGNKFYYDGTEIPKNKFDIKEKKS